MSDQQTSEAMGEFWEFTKDFQSIEAWTAKVAVSWPFADLAMNFGPPWPSRIAVCSMVSLIQIVVLMCAFEFWRYGVRRYLYIRIAMLIGVMLFLPSLWYYIEYSSRYICEAPDQWNRAVHGGDSFVDDSLAQMVKQDRSRWTPQNLMREFGVEEKIWTTTSLAHNRKLVLFLWLSTWSSFAFIIASFVALQWKRKSKVKKN